MVLYICLLICSSTWVIRDGVNFSGAFACDRAGGVTLIEIINLNQGLAEAEMEVDGSKQQKELVKRVGGLLSGRTGQKDNKNKRLTNNIR